MDQPNQLKLAFASAKAALVSIIVVTAITVWAEFDAGLKAWLAGFTGHHWVSKSWLALIVYAVFLAVFYVQAKKSSEVKLAPAIWLLIAAAILGFAVLTGFFLIHYQIV